MSERIPISRRRVLKSPIFISILQNPQVQKPPTPKVSNQKKSTSVIGNTIQLGNTIEDIMKAASIITEGPISRRALLGIPNPPEETSEQIQATVNNSEPVERDNSL